MVRRIRTIKKLGSYSLGNRYTLRHYIGVKGLGGALRPHLRLVYRSIMRASSPAGT